MPSILVREAPVALNFSSQFQMIFIGTNNEVYKVHPVILLVQE